MNGRFCQSAPSQATRPFQPSQGATAYGQYLSRAGILPRVPIVLLTLLGALLRFYAIGRQGFWYDESYTVLLVGRGPGEMFRLIPQLESTPPLYYCVAWVWARLFGFGPAALKSLSAVCGTLAIPVAYAAARKLLPGRRAALIVAALAACSPFLIWYSQEARAYSLLMLLSALFLLAFAHVREDPRPRAVALWSVTGSLALLTHYYAVIVLVPQAIWLLYEHRRSRAIWAGIAGIALVGLALTPLAIAQDGTHSNRWIARSSYLRRLKQIPSIFLVGPETHLRVLLEFVGYGMVAIGIALLIWRTCRPERQRARLAGGLALAGFLLSAIPGHNTFLARNLLPIWLPAAILLAAGLGATRARVLGISTTMVLCTIGVIAVISVDTTDAYQRPDWQFVAQALGRWPAPGQAAGDGRIVVVQDNPGLMPLKLYVKDLRYINRPTLYRIAEIDVVAALPHRGLGGFCWWGSECNLVPSRLNRRYRIPGFRVVARRRVRDFGILVMRASKPQTVRVSQLPRARGHQHRHFVRSGHEPLHDARLIEQT